VFAFDVVRPLEAVQRTQALIGAGSLLSGNNLYEREANTMTGSSLCARLGYCNW
jgi:hypothetical protein